MISAPILFLLLIAVLVDAYVFRRLRAMPRKMWWHAAAWRQVFRVGRMAGPPVLAVAVGLPPLWSAPPVVAGFAAALAVLWYAPRLLTAAILLVHDTLRSITRLFAWFQDLLLDDHAHDDLQPALLPLVATTRGPVVADLSDLKRVRRRDVLRQMAPRPHHVPAVLVGYSLFRRLYDFEVLPVTIPVRGLPRALDGLRIAQISDLHAGDLFSPRPLEEAVALIQAARPDLITITGDFVSYDAEEIRPFLPALDRLRAPLGVYGSLGNHDHYADVGALAQLLGTTTVDLLVNQGRTLRIEGARLHVLGTDNTGYGQTFADLPRALADLDRTDADREASVLLAHDPTFWDQHVRRGFPEIDLMLAGHTHGGQIGVRFRRRTRLSIAQTVYRRWAGLYREETDHARGAHHLYVNRGLGTVGAPIRWGVRPEITLLTLQRAG